MSLMAQYVDGKLQTSTTSSQSLANTSSENKNTVNGDMFLKLLVAEMKNQDPLEPTSNTEWVSQYATFTQVEEMGEMRDSMNVMRANGLIGKEVVMKVTSEATGEISYKRGNVDYVVMESGKALLVIDEEKYSMDDLDSVASPEYFEAYDKYSDFTSKIDALPSLNAIDKTYQDVIGEIYDLYNDLSDYQLNYIESYAPGYINSYKSYLSKMEQFGITFDKEEEKKVTLDDVMNSFNQRMDEIMERIDKLSAGNSNNTSSDNNKDNNPEDGSEAVNA